MKSLIARAKRVWWG